MTAEQSFGSFLCDLPMFFSRHVHASLFLLRKQAFEYDMEKFITEYWHKDQLLDFPLAFFFKLRLF